LFLYTRHKPAPYWIRHCSTQQGERPHRHPRPRLETLSDLIYRLSLPIGAISLVITNSTASNAGDVDRNILEFLFVFLIIITSWIIYTSDMSVLPLETRLVTFLNVILLILVAIIPYLFDQAVSLNNTPDFQNYASTLFRFVHAGSLSIMAGFAHLIAQEEKTARRQRPSDRVPKNTNQTNNPNPRSAPLPRSSLGLVPPRNTRQIIDLVCADHLILGQPNER